ncbi:class I SAM-dependent methyltransferase [Alicyclobacillus acidiphilus]|uniref:class I SAM-dependent methyltransferase n=1 Tax=Alicyclobacillus acidiphilus TaxID=182455 RepID=UPI00082E4BAF|nr:class I SAM-dependent methyltransferase [Alicyclobacillus acidiphilus]
MPKNDWNDAQTAQAWDVNGDSRNPIRAEQLDILVSVLADALQPDDWFVDLGFGSGKVEELIFSKIAGVRGIGIDMSEAMMKLAEDRLKPYRGRFETVARNLADLSTLQLDKPIRAAVAVQSLHHLSQEAMYAAYQWIYQTLEPGGVFLLSDRMQVASAAQWTLLRSLWKRQDRLYHSHVTPHEGDSFEHHQQTVIDRGDYPIPLIQQLTWLQSIGFDAFCLHVHAHRALIAAVKPAEGPKVATTE